MASILDMMQGIEAAGDRGRARGQQSRLASLYSQAIGAPREQRTDYLSQIAAVSPDAANAASGMFDQWDDNQRAELGRYAIAFDALPDDQKAQAYPQLAQQAAQMGLPVPQGGYRPEYAQGIRQLAQAFGGASANANNVQSRFVNDQGEVMALLRDGTVINTGERSDPQRWFRDLPGMAPQVVDEFGRVSGVGQPQRATGEVPFSIDPRLPPEVQAAIRANPDAGSARGITSLDMGGGVQARPSEAQVAAEQEAAKRGVALQYAPAEARAAAQATRATERAKAEVAREQEQAQRDTTFQQFETAMDALESGLAGTATNPVTGNLPAVTANQQIAEGAVAAIAPILKQLFRAAGEGVFTDKDQELLMAMVPTREDFPAARASKIANIRSIVAAKLGQTTEPAQNGAGAASDSADPLGIL